LPPEQVKHFSAVSVSCAAPSWASLYKPTTMSIFSDKETATKEKRFDPVEWQNRQRMREYAREEKKALAENYIVPLVTQWTAHAEGIAPPDHDIYAVPKGTAVTTNRRRRERHPIGSDGGFVMLSRGQVQSLLGNAKFTRSGAVQAVFFRLLCCAGYGGDIDPVSASVPSLTQALSISRQHVYNAYELLYELDLIRPRDPKQRWQGWVLNPAVAFCGDGQLFLEREAEFLHSTPKAPDVSRTRSRSKTRRNQRAKDSKKQKAKPSKHRPPAKK
jgi:hypothetical protein